MRIPVFCSLIPAELIASLGVKPVFIRADECFVSRPKADGCVFHENLCSYVKALHDYLIAHSDDYTLIIVPSACDAMKKLYNALASALGTDKTHLLDVPQSRTKGAGDYLAGEFTRLSERLKKIGVAKISPPLKDCAAVPSPLMGEGQDGGESDKIAHPPLNPLPSREGIQPQIYKRPSIGIIGSNVPLNTIKDRVHKFGFGMTYINHCIEKAGPDESLSSALNGRGLAEYARLFMEKNSCPRTDGEGYRMRLLKTIAEQNIKGLIVNAFKFCDFQPFDYKFFKDAMGPDFPIILIEHDLTADTEGQTMTRIDAFLENIAGVVRAGKKAPRTDGRVYAGIDSGSHATKLVCVDGEGKILARKIIPTGTSVKKSAENLVEGLLKEIGAKRNDIARVIATGYGRNEIGGADEIVTEITCHAIGAYRTLSKPATLVDIGGQDSKAIKIGEGGHVERFAMNDKCAAGTGRFLEVMAAKLEMSLKEFGALSKRASSFVPISNMCSVFAESEVISLIASGKSREAIAKGIHRSIAERTVALMRRIGGEPPYYIAGGGAKNEGLVFELGECLGEKVLVLDEPQYSGAFGAAILAMGAG